MAYDSQVMLDIETFSTKNNAVIVSIGACRFAAEKGIILDTFKVNVDPRDCKKLGLHVSKSTMEFWAKQSPEARKCWSVDPKPLKEALESFSDWYGTKSVNTYSKGTVFDIGILENAYDVCGMPPPWKPFQICDYRTILTILKLDDKSSKKAGSTYHDALDDAVNQAEFLMPLLQAFAEYEAF